MKRILLDKWTSMFLAWPEWVSFYYVNTAETITKDSGVVLCAQIVGSLRLDLCFVLAAVQNYKRTVKQRSLEGFLSFLRNGGFRRVGREEYSRIFGLARLICTFILRRGATIGVGEFETFVESLERLYEKTTILARRTPKLPGPPICRNNQICPTRGLLCKFVKSEEFQHLQDMARSFMLDDVFPRLVRLCCAALEHQQQGKDPDVILDSWEATEDFLRQVVTEVQRLRTSSDPLLRAISTWILERKFLLRMNQRLRDVADAIERSNERECFCVRWSNALFLALTTMDRWANGEKVCEFECAKRFLSFDRLLRFLGPDYIVDLNGHRYGVDSRGEKKLRCAREVSLRDSGGRSHLGVTRNVSIPVHGILVDWGGNITGFRLCSEIFTLEGIGRGEAEFTPFSDLSEGKEMAFRWLHDLCQDGLEPLYAYD